jgi:methoxymalonate biosynthesis protein
MGHDVERPVLVKCLVWDLDNTLWQGTLLEDDRVDLFEGIRETVIELDSRGILQSVSSKNDDDLAMAKLREFGLDEYFVLPRIGWGPKSDSIRAIAGELNFSERTIAFIDDQPAERAEVAFSLPEVRCYSAEDAASLLTRPEFTPEVVTADAGGRRAMYQAGFRRQAERQEFTGPDEDFLRSLELVMTIGRATPVDLSRVEELTLRTSQMNATGVHYSDAALRELIEDQTHEVLVVSMTDRFGPHGAVGVMLIERLATVWHLKLLATSCRVVSFGAGATILRWLTDQAARAGVRLVADFRATDRNRMMEIAYRFAGFEDQPAAGVAELPAPTAEGVRYLYLEPARQEPSTTIRLIAPELALVGSPE